jgi:energy-coupling factor transporter transmembrane protein EcfT
VRRSRSEAERVFSIRLALFSWLAGFVFLIALLFLPNKQRVLLMIPIFLVAVTVAKLWRDGRARLRREHEERDRFERMKRIN